MGFSTKQNGGIFLPFLLYGILIAGYTRQNY
jgi:hypothetical protein